MVKFLLSLVLTLGVLLPLLVSAAPVTYWFAGTVTSTNNPGLNMPSGIQIGTPFSGRISYDMAHLSYSNLTSFPPGTVGNYYFDTLPGFTLLLQIGGHTMTNDEIKVSQWSGDIHVYNDFVGADSLNVYGGFSGLVTDGQVDTNSNISLQLRDSSQTAFSSAALPDQPPSLAAFTNGASFNWSQRDASDNLRFSITGQLTQISTNELVALNILRADTNTVRLAWPLAVSGGQLQCVTNLFSTNWQAVADSVVPAGMENTVTLPANDASKFYRLRFAP